MTEKGISNERKKELEQMDAFQANVLKSMEVAKKYKKPLLLGVVVVILVIAAFAGTMTSLKHSRENASQLLAKAVEVHAKNTDPKAGYDAVRQDFQKIFDEYSNTPAGKMARIQFGHMAYMAGDYDTANQMYEKAYEFFQKDANLKELLLLCRANILVEQKEYGKASGLFDKAFGGGDGIWKAQAGFMIARLSEFNEDPADVRKNYEKVSGEKSSSMYQEMAKDRMIRLN